MKQNRARSTWVAFGTLSTLSCAPAVPKSQPGPVAAPTSVSAPGAAVELDDFESLAAWEVETSDGVKASIAPVEGVRGRAMRLDFDFRNHGGHASARRALPLELPESYEISFQLRGEALPNDLQFKLVDASGDNVWWFRRADFVPPSAFQRFIIKKRQVEFAWGPSQDKTLRRAASVEFVIAAGKGGGKGSVTIDDLQIRAVPRAPAAPPRPIATGSVTIGDAEASRAVDGRRDTRWRCPAGAQQLDLDLGYAREFGGLVLRWAAGAHASRYDVALSEDGSSYRVVRSVNGSDGGKDALLLPESEARYVRLVLHAAAGPEYGLEEVEVHPIAFGATPNAFVSALAKEAPRGVYPRAFGGEQPYWTLVGLDGASSSGLMSEDGAIEFGKAGFSVEPFVISNGKLRSWADVTMTQSLEDGYLPLPSVHWRDPAWELRVESFALGDAATTELAARYELRNLTDAPIALSLALAVRPFQVNPPTQTLNLPGGVSPITRLGWDGKVLSVNGAPALLPAVSPSRVVLQTFDGGGFPERELRSTQNAAADVTDATGLASAVLVYDVQLAPGERVGFANVGPLGAPSGASRGAPRSLASLAAERARVAGQWRKKLNHVGISVPPAGRALIDTLRSSLAHILMSRDGPMLKPGTRSYARSWIRDGAMISESLLRLGHAAVAAEYLSWYTPHLFDNGKVPCCVDARGPDPVPENDSAGEYIFLAAETFRFTRDRALLERVWPGVEAAARYMEQLRQSERTAKNLTPERRAYYGLMPPSISHEGYSDKPAYSYWDNFWALIGYEDATELAAALDKSEARDKLAQQRDEFRRELYASIRAATKRSRIPFIPGAADRGDFDATSTTIALAPGREAERLPRDLLLSTFERYFSEFTARRKGERKWDVYTPYELRVVGTFVRLGWRERAWELLDFFMNDRRPTAWNQWAEVVGRDAREPRFIGDMPHAWISSDYIRSVLDLFAYVRQSDDSLVLGAGVPAEWWHAGFGIRDLRTPHGPVSFSSRGEGERVIIEVVRGAAPGGMTLRWPYAGKPPSTTIVNGKPAAWQEGELRIPRAPARIRFERPGPG